MFYDKMDRIMKKCPVTQLSDTVEVIASMTVRGRSGDDHCDLSELGIQCQGSEEFEGPA